MDGCGHDCVPQRKREGGAGGQRIGGPVARRRAAERARMRGARAEVEAGVAVGAGREDEAGIRVKEKEAGEGGRKSVKFVGE